MRRLPALLLSAVLAAALAVPLAAQAGAAPDTTATVSVPDDAVVLAVEGAEQEEAPGPDPSPPDASGNPAAPDDYEANFLWGAAVGLLVLTVVAVVGVGVLYYLLVVRPRRREPAEAS